MGEFNPLLEALTPKIQQLIASLIKPTVLATKPQRRLAFKAYSTAIETVVLHIHKHFDIIAKMLQQSPPSWDLEKLKAITTTIQFTQSIEGPKTDK